MGQQPAELRPHASARHFLGAELRCWRQQRGLSLARLAALVYVSPDLLGKIEKAERTASLDVMSRCDQALETGGALARLRRFVDQQAAVQPRTDASAMMPTRFMVIMEILPVGPVDSDAAPLVNSGGRSRLYALHGGQGR
ncbi:helix-turn-helix transcriptional regulator [Micromonospora sp. WMMD998]|uniref:helix-turn-helix domain-containing protein n=1 Tax=Micromonospora sp. WMMD998 TaxID=3016092 RepID=UPI00249B1F6D|nr:helix-turn-helix transcriptional regulator [Micromonospora sp. WMMD998]WFE38059.1 helix-turn-helix transcriptional regulator [Micromonospora sp. WMMD998]